MKPLWTGKLDHLKKKAKKTGFLREFYYPLPADGDFGPTRMDAVNLDHLRSGMEAAERLHRLHPDKVPALAKVKGWALGMGYDPAGWWHLTLIAVPYRRPTYVNDWELAGDILDYLGVTPEAVDEALGDSPWPFAAHSFHWPEGSRRRTGFMCKVIPALMGWATNWKERLDILKNEALAKGSRADHEIQDLALEHVAKTGTPFLVGNPNVAVSPEIAAKVGGLVAKAHAMGWEFCLMLILAEKGALWSLSAMLYPYKRSSKKDDWNFLGKALKYLGVPDPMKPISEGGSLVVMHDDANRPSHWQWRSQI